MNLSEDIVQDVFLHLWKNKDTLNINSNPKAYLFKAVYNKVIEHYRSEKGRNGQNLSSDNINFMVYSDNFEEIGNKYMLKDRIYHSIRQLPDQCQRIFVLSKIEGKKYAEIATELNLSLKTVETQMTKAFKILRELLSEYKDNGY